MRDWIADAVIYQVNLRAFAAREPRNPVEAAAGVREAESGSRGDNPLVFLAQNLEYIAGLGASVVYVMPPFPMGIEGRLGVGSPYAIRDFRAVDPEYGSLPDFVNLVERAHELGLRIILDLTPNHTSCDHAWVTTPGMYCRTPDGRLYHDFDWSDTAKLDYTHAQTRVEMRNVLQFWLDVCQGDGVDGFRFDMAHLLNDLSFWDETLALLRAQHSGRDLLFLAESYGLARNRDLFGRGMDAAYDDDFYKVCQYGYARDREGRTRVCLSKAAFGNADFSAKAEAFASGGIAAAFERVLMDYEDPAIGAGGHRLARYVDNHDEGRGCYRFGDGAVRAAMRLVFLSGHCLPFLLCGQEFGAMNRPTIHERIGPCEKGYRVCRSSCEQCGFVAGVEFEGNLFARGSAARAGWQAFYRELIALRAAHPVLRRGTTALCDVGEICDWHDRTVVGFERAFEGIKVRCAVNMGAEPRRLENLPALAGDILYGELENGCLPPFTALVSQVE